MKYLLSLVVFLSGINCTAQNWLWAQSTTGSIYADEGLCVATDASGNSFLGGSFASPTLTFGSITINQTPNCGTGFIAKFDANGNPLWAKSTGCGSIWSIATDASGNVYFTGDYLGYANLGSCSLSNSGDGDYFLAKFDPNGNCLWSRTATGITGDRGYDVEVSTTGEVYVAGLYTSVSINFGSNTLNNTSQGWDQIFLAKYSSGGNLIWAKSAGGSQQDDVYNVATDNSGNVYISGWFQGSASSFGNFTIASSASRDIFLAKYDSSGTALWAEPFGGVYDEEAYSIDCDPSGNVVMAGMFTSPSITFGSQTITNPGSNWAGFLAKFDPSGTPLWAYAAIGLNNTASGYSVDTYTNGNIVFGGGSGCSQVTFGTTTLVSPANYVDPAFIIILTPGGTVQCSAVLSSGADDQNGVAFDPNGDVILGGDFENVDPFIVGNDSLALDSIEDVFIAKFRCSSEVGIENSATPYSISVFPNPLSDIVTFKIESLSEQFTINIYDTFGRIVKHLEFTTSESIVDLGENAAGIYFYTISDSDGVISSGKLLLE